MERYNPIISYEKDSFMALARQRGVHLEESECRPFFDYVLNLWITCFNSSNIDSRVTSLPSCGLVGVWESSNGGGDAVPFISYAHSDKEGLLLKLIENRNGAGYFVLSNLTDFIEQGLPTFLSNFRDRKN